MFLMDANERWSKSFKRDRGNDQRVRGRRRERNCIKRILQFCPRVLEIMQKFTLG